jgi:hypothetical protein
MGKKIFICILAIIFFSGSSYSQDKKKNTKSDAPKSTKSDTLKKQKKEKKDLHLFDSNEVLNITLRFNLSTFIRKKSKTEYLDAVMTINPGEKDSIRTNLKLKARGEIRNVICYFPLVELNLKKLEFKYADLDKIKLVDQCNTGNEYEDYVLREYLIYKLYNVLTDTSFRVRLLSLKLIESQKNKKPVKQYGFFIEPLEMLAKRTNTTIVEATALNQKSIKEGSMDRVAIFNYMVGNYDWAIPGQHNVRVLKSMIFEPEALGIAVPYDFDWAGLVNASYAIPAENVGLESVRERLFLGICRTKEVYRKDLEEFIEKKDKFYSVVREFPYLSQKSKQYIINYLNDFYSQVEAKNVITNIFLNSCKKF